MEREPTEGVMVPSEGDERSVDADIDLVMPPTADRVGLDMASAAVLVGGGLSVHETEPSLPFPSFVCVVGTRSGRLYG